MLGGCSKGVPFMKQRLSCWIDDAIALAYTSVDIQCPTGERANYTRGMASFWACPSGVLIEDIRAAAG